MPRDLSGADTLLRDVFGFDAFRPGQGEIVEAVAQGENVLAIMPTGGGKSLCFQLPALMRPGVTVVISPLIALMRDQVRGLREAGGEAYLPLLYATGLFDEAIEKLSALDAGGALASRIEGLRAIATTIGDRVFIGSGTELIAPVTLGDDAYVAAGSCITNDVPAGALGVARARQVNKEDWVTRRKKVLDESPSDA